MITNSDMDVRLSDRLQEIEKKLKTSAADDQLLTVKEVAIIMKCSLSTSNKLFNDSRFPGKRIPNVGWRVRSSKLYEFFDTYDNYENNL